MSSLLSGFSDFFGLDIGTTAARLVQLKGNGASKALLKYAYVPLEGNVSTSDSKGDQQKLAQVIAQLVKQAGVSTNNVAVGIRTAGAVAAFQLVKPRLEWRVRITPVEVAPQRQQWHQPHPHSRDKAD